MITIFIAAIMIFSVFPCSVLGKELGEAESKALIGEAKSVILIEAKTGKVLFEHEADIRLAPASVTKIMSILLVVEEIERGTLSLGDIISVSDNASHMGGSQVYLKAGEQMSVGELLKCVVIASANDAATALAEQVAGSVEGFVVLMNKRASELGMTNTVFENPTGLDDSTKDHKTTARDISIMSRELMKHDMILNYTTVWTDSIRNGAFGLTNTNRLIRFYSGANGLKTGSTSKAGFCISAAAKRDNMQLIAVVMGSPNRDSRNETAKKLLDYGFANYRYLFAESGETAPIKVNGGKQDSCRLVYGSFEAVLEKSSAAGELFTETVMPESITAPVEIGDVIGTVNYKLGDSIIGSVDIVAAENIEKISGITLFMRIVSSVFMN